MMMIEAHIAAMAACEALTKTAGVKAQGGKQYLEVKHRVSEFRKAYGLEYGIQTNLLEAGDKYVRVHALILDRQGNVIGSGMAEEVRGKGPVNTTSAVENAETSAIGRALASIGLHGGEYASANEMHGVDRKKEALAESDLVPDNEPHDSSFKANFGNSALRTAFQKNATAAMEACETQAELQSAFQQYWPKIENCQASPNHHDRLFAEELVRVKDRQKLFIQQQESLKAGMPEGFNNTK